MNNSIDLKPSALVLCGTCLGSGTLQDRLNAAQAGGFDALTLSPQDYWSARDGGLADDQFAPAIESHGLQIAEVDPLVLWDVDVQALTLGHLRPGVRDTIRVASLLEAPAVNVCMPSSAPIATDSIFRAIDHLSKVCAQASLRVQIEFLPWSQVPDLATAAALVERIGRDNTGIMFDTWHHARSGGTDVDIDRHGGLVTAIQISDAPLRPSGDIMAETLTARRMPGDGELALTAMLGKLRRAGSMAPWGIEVLNDQIRGLTPIEAARQLGEALKDLRRQAEKTTGGDP